MGGPVDAGPGKGPPEPNGTWGVVEVQGAGAKEVAVGEARLEEVKEEEEEGAKDGLMGVPPKPF